MSATVFVAFRGALLDNLDDTLNSSALANVNLVDRTSLPPKLLLADEQLLDIEDEEWSASTTSRAASSTTATRRRTTREAS